MHLMSVGTNKTKNSFFEKPRHHRNCVGVRIEPAGWADFRRGGGFRALECSTF